MDEVELSKSIFALRSPEQIEQEYREVSASIPLAVAKYDEKNIPDFFPVPYDNPMWMMARDYLVPKIGFVNIANNWLKPLAKWIGERKCLEVMSGTGALTYGLRKHGVDIIPTDDMSWNWNESWCEVEQLDAVAAIEKYGKEVHIVIMAWPPYRSDIAVKVVKALRDINPFAVIVYIGEWDGGCCADDDFFKNVERIQDKTFKKIASEYPSYFGIHDTLWLLK